MLAWCSAALVAGLVGAGCADDGGPRLDAVSPAAASRNATVTITGRRLCGARGDCSRATGEVDLGLDPPMVRAIVVSYADTRAQIVIPPVAPVGSSALIVTVDERSSNALDFEVLP
ncbi:MAG TPA: IPT/TIG domain-containing protein [Kofleriaceae bacterium]|nr:IPT/TIG domain-containing protein [Kofleriaceae bacterium]